MSFAVRRSSSPGPFAITYVAVGRHRTHKSFARDGRNDFAKQISSATYSTKKCPLYSASLFLMLLIIFMTMIRQCRKNMFVLGERSWAIDAL